jgi:hypothetical protein
VRLACAPGKEIGMNVRFWRLVALLVATASTACAARSEAAPSAMAGAAMEPQATGAPMRDAPAEPAPASAGAAMPAPPPPPSPATSPAGSPAKDATGRVAEKPAPPGEVASVRAPMLIYTADITMAVYEVAPGIARVEELARQIGGYLARRDDRSITIRVPAARFDEAVKRIETFGDVLHRNVVAEDVTEEFRDLEVRLKSLRAVRDRLEQLLQKAAKVEESVAIERELERVSGEIDRIEGRMKFLRDRAAFSTITVTFAPRRSDEQPKSTFRLPVPWLNELGLGRLLSL